MDKYKVTHFISGEKTLCGLQPNVHATKSVAWFKGMKHHCKKCDKLLNHNNDSIPLA